MNCDGVTDNKRPDNNNIKKLYVDGVTKTLPSYSTETGLTQSLHNAWDLITEQQTHADFKEGTNSFIEKRSPNWAPYKNNE